MQEENPFDRIKQKIENQEKKDIIPGLEEINFDDLPGKLGSRLKEAIESGNPLSLLTGMMDDNFSIPTRITETLKRIFGDTIGEMVTKEILEDVMVPLVKGGVIVDILKVKSIGAKTLDDMLPLMSKKPFAFYLQERINNIIANLDLMYVTTNGTHIVIPGVDISKKQMLLSLFAQASTISTGILDDIADEIKNNDNFIEDIKQVAGESFDLTLIDALLNPIKLLNVKANLVKDLSIKINNMIQLV